MKLLVGGPAFAFDDHGSRGMAAVSSFASGPDKVNLAGGAEVKSGRRCPTTCWLRRQKQLPRGRRHGENISERSFCRRKSKLSGSSLAARKDDDQSKIQASHESYNISNVTRMYGRARFELLNVVVTTCRRGRWKNSPFLSPFHRFSFFELSTS